MAIAYKGVNASGKSPGTANRPGGFLSPDSPGFTELSYGLGEVVTAPVGSDGIYAFAHRGGQYVSAEYAAGSGVPFAGGHRVELEYDVADTIASDYAGGYGCSEVRLAEATVVGIRSPSSASLNTSTAFDLEVAIGNATGAVTYSAALPDTTVVASGTATHPGTGHYVATFTTPASATELTITWSGTWSAVARTLRTYALIR